jgi:hypothetical protein
MILARTWAVYEPHGPHLKDILKYANRFWQFPPNQLISMYRKTADSRTHHPIFISTKLSVTEKKVLGELSDKDDKGKKLAREEEEEEEEEEEFVIAQDENGN